MQSPLSIATCLLVFCGGCKSADGEAAAERRRPTDPPNTAIIDAALQGPDLRTPPVAPAPHEVGGAAIKQRMQLQMDSVSSIQNAVIDGDLAKVKEHAALIAKGGSHVFPDDWDLHLLQMKATAGELADSKDIAEAAKKTAMLGLQCANCHDDLTALVSFEWSEAPLSGGDTKTSMQRHRWAAARLWEGFVAPSDTLWKRGAEALAAERIDVDAALKGKAPAQARTLAAEVRELGNRALITSSADARADVVGNLLNTCSRCHALVREPK